MFDSLAVDLSKLKIGEIYWPSSDAYFVQCCTCKASIAIEEFQEHFQEQHFYKKFISSFLEVDEEDEDADVAENGKETLSWNVEQPEQLETEDEELIDMIEIQKNRIAVVDVIKPAQQQQQCNKSSFLQSNEIANNKETMPQADRIQADMEQDDSDWSNDNAMQDEDDSMVTVSSKANVAADDDTNDVDDNDAANDDNDAAEDDDYDNDDDADYVVKDNKDDDASSDSDSNFSVPLAHLKTNETFHCPHCKRKYFTNKGLEQHLAKRLTKQSNCFVNSSTFDFKCTLCRRQFRRADQFQKHKTSHANSTCDICGKVFPAPANMKRHRLYHSNERAYECEECGKAYKTDENLQTHMQRHYERQMCDICGKLVYNTADLKRHMKRHTGERPCKCNVCGKSFFETNDLNTHLVTHSAARPFECDVCHATFKLKRSLRVHKKKHSTQALSFVCTMCEKAFALEKGLIAHMRSHNVAEHNVTILIK